jgi:hypothetical protein
MLLGGLNPMTKTIAHRAMAASPTRRVTMVSGGNSATATPTKKKEPPHNTDKAINISHSGAPMEVLIGDVALDFILDLTIKTRLVSWKG